MRSIPIAVALIFSAASAATAQDTKSATEADLPAGDAKPIVAATCTACHDLSRIVSANHSAAEWRSVVNMMTAAGAKLSASEKDAVTQYLVASFPPRRIAVSGDGAVWYSDYTRGRLGRLDPKTGKVTEYPSPGGPRSEPYAIAALNGVIWYVETGVEPNVLVRFDPAADKFQTWAIPSGGGVVRNMMPTHDGNLALACSAVNGIALVEIKHGGGS